MPTDAGPLSDQEVADFCASFQRVVVEALVDRTFDAARILGAKSIGTSRGAFRPAADSGAMRPLAGSAKASVYFPSLKLLHLTTRR